jgi:hypothetical protein
VGKQGWIQGSRSRDREREGVGGGNKERIQSYDTRVGTAEFELGGNGSRQG